MPHIQMRHVAHTMSYPTYNLDESWHNRGMSWLCITFSSCMFLVCVRHEHMCIFVCSMSICV